MNNPIQYEIVRKSLNTRDQTIQIRTTNLGIYPEPALRNDNYGRALMGLIIPDFGNLVPNSDHYIWDYTLDTVGTHNYYALNVIVTAKGGHEPSDAQLINDLFTLADNVNERAKAMHPVATQLAQHAAKITTLQSKLDALREDYATDIAELRGNVGELIQQSKKDEWNDAQLSLEKRLVDVTNIVTNHRDTFLRRISALEDDYSDTADTIARYNMIDRLDELEKRMTEYDTHLVDPPATITELDANLHLIQQRMTVNNNRLRRLEEILEQLAAHIDGAIDD